MNGSLSSEPARVICICWLGIILRFWDWGSLCNLGRRRALTQMFDHVKSVTREKSLKRVSLMILSAFSAQSNSPIPHDLADMAMAFIAHGRARSLACAKPALGAASPLWAPASTFAAARLLHQSNTLRQEAAASTSSDGPTADVRAKLKDALKTAMKARDKSMTTTIKVRAGACRLGDDVGTTARTYHHTAFRSRPSPISHTKKNHPRSQTRRPTTGL